MKGRILVVDDEPRQRDILQMILESEGYITTAAGNGRQALEAATEEACDVVLTDLKMPDMSGIQLLEALLKSQPNACVVLMTAHGSIDSAVEAMRRGAFDYLTKPLDKDALLLSLRRALERSRLVRENRLLKEQLRDRFRLNAIVGSHGSMQDVCFLRANDDLLTYKATRRLVTPTSEEAVNTVMQIDDRLFKTGVLHKMPAALQARFFRPDPHGRTVLPFFRNLSAAGMLTCYSAFGQPRDVIP